MAGKNKIDIDTLWRLERLSAPSLSPDGAQAVCAVTRPSMKDNRAHGSLWLLSTLGGRPRPLTHAGDRDSQPRFSPRGDGVGFLAQRDQEGHKDEEAQFYIIAPDGGEARRVGLVATGVEAFKWFPDGKRIAFISWVWPELRGAAAQAKAHKTFKARKETGYATSEACTRWWDRFLPMGRVPHLHVMDLATGRVNDLFEGTTWELSRFDPDASCFDISPDGKRIVFSFDPDPAHRVDARHALACIEWRGRRVSELVRDAQWDLTAPRFSPEGDRVAFLAAHDGRKHTMPKQLGVWTVEDNTWDVVSAQWDHEVQAPLLWEDGGQALLFTAEQTGRQHLWRFDLLDRRAEIVASGGCVSAFDKVAGTLVTLDDGAQHPPRLHAHLPGLAPRRMEHFNDRTLSAFDLGRHEEIWITGALGDQVQVWLHYPPGFDAKRRWPVMHTIHGGPHAVSGDNWSWRWNSKVFAAQGYVVVSVNYHGSTSFGHAFLDSITHRWGELELQDVEAATDWLLRQSWVDPRRVFATGGSYGGYMVAWMNGLAQPGRYAAYVCHAGCYDWTAMMADDAWPWHAKELGAWDWADPARVAAQSPHTHAAAFSTPTLVIHGALDYRVPDAQGLAYYNTLKARGIPARLLWFPDEHHWVLKPRNSKMWHEELFAWLRQHDPAAKTARGRRR